MDRRGMPRREALRNAGLLAGGAAIGGLALASPADADDSRERGLTGSWMITRRQAGEPEDSIAVLSLAAGGVAINHDILPAGPPFTGTWAGHGREFRATLWTGFPGDSGPGSRGPALRVTARGRLRGGEISGTYEGVVYASGISGPAAETFRGSFTGRRIDA